MEVSRQLLNWKHSGFSLDAGNKPVAAHNAEGRRQLAEYLLRAPFSLEKITWVEKTRRVIYRSRRSWRTKRNFEVFTATNPASRTAIQGGRQKEFPRSNRKTIARLIREWQADLVFTHRPHDYHPDHRNAGLLIRDAAFMVGVPFYVPDTPPVKRNPVFMYFPDRFTRPYPFQADIAISIDDVFDKKVHALDALESQVYEGGANGSAQTLIQRKAHDPVARKEILKAGWTGRNGRIADRFRKSLVKWYGPEKGKAVKTAEAFEVCEYGRRPSEAELKILFPFFKK